MAEEYKELVRLLKDKAERFDYDGWVDTAVVMEKAADAIEELTAVAESYKRSMEAWADTAGKAVEQMHRWVSVADRLPEPEGHHEYIVCVKHSNPELKAVFVTTAEFEARVIECGVEPFWDGYEDGIVRVTHWMPFPEPPKEET